MISGSPSGLLNGTDLKKVAIGAGLSALGAVVAYVLSLVPAMEESGNATLLMIAAVIPVAANLIRKWIADNQPTSDDIRNIQGMGRKAAILLAVSVLFVGCCEPLCAQEPEVDAEVQIDVPKPENESRRLTPNLRKRTLKMTLRRLSRSRRHGLSPEQKSLMAEAARDGDLLALLDAEMEKKANVVLDAGIAKADMQLVESAIGDGAIREQVQAFIQFLIDNREEIAALIKLIITLFAAIESGDHETVAAISAAIDCDLLETLSAA